MSKFLEVRTIGKRKKTGKRVAEWWGERWFKIFSRESGKT